MANHAYIVEMKKFPTEKEIVETLNDFNKKHLFNELIVKKEENGYSLSIDDCICDNVFLYVDKIRNRKCLEFVHGHCSDLFWWLDFEIEHEFARKFEGKIEDDADGIKQKPRKNFRSFKKFMDRKFNGCPKLKVAYTILSWIELMMPQDELQKFAKKLLRIKEI